MISTLDLIDHAVYRTLFGDKTHLNKTDFAHELFVNDQGWDKSHKIDGGPSGMTVNSGSKVIFPIVANLYL